jgi:hypothetical protein
MACRPSHSGARPSLLHADISSAEDFRLDFPLFVSDWERNSALCRISYYLIADQSRARRGACRSATFPR